MRGRNLAILLLTIALFIGPVLLGFLINGWTHAFSSLVGDAFYYLEVGRNAAVHGRLSFDMERPTNCFHPLWQAWVTLLYATWTYLGLPDLLMLFAVVISGAVFISLGLCFLAKYFRQTRGRVPLSFLFLPTGVFALATLPVLPRCGPLWGYADGMESCLAIAAYALLLYNMVRPAFLRSASSAAATGFLLGILCLSRLDHALFLISFAGCVLGRALVRRDREQFLRGGISCLVPVCMIGLYLLVNLAYSGGAIPLSGMAKASLSPSSLVGNVRAITTALLFPHRTHGAFIRSAQIVLPAACALIALGRAIRLLAKGTFREGDFALTVTALFVLLLASYNTAFVSLHHQGFWYFPVSVLFVSVFSFHVLGAWRAEQWVGRRSAVWVATLVVLWQLLFYLAVYWNQDNSGGYRDLIQREVPLLRAHYAGEAPRLVEYDDGAIAWATGYPAFSGMMLSTDKEAFDWWRSRKPVLVLACNRGFDRITTWAYGDELTQLHDDSLHEEVKYRMERTTRLGPDANGALPLVFEVEYVSPSARLVVIRMRRLDAHYLKAVELERAGDWQGVVRELEKVLGSGHLPYCGPSPEPCPAASYNMLGEAFEHLGEASEAERAFERAVSDNVRLLEEHPYSRPEQSFDLMDLNLNAAWALSRLGKVSEARRYLGAGKEALSRALALCPWNERLYYRVLDKLWRARLLGEVQEMARMAHEKFPFNEVFEMLSRETPTDAEFRARMGSRP